MHTSHLSFHHETLHEELARIVSSQAVVEACTGTGGGEEGKSSQVWRGPADADNCVCN